MSYYEEKKKARIDRLNNAADRVENRAQELFDSSKKMASVIPFGQPILVGHHSEQRDRNYRKKIENKMGKAVESYEYAKELRRRAEAAEKNTAISSDDPEAVQKLTEKLETLKEFQDEMKAMNGYYRKHGTCKKYKDMPDDEATQLDERIKNDYSWQRQPYPTYLLTNNNSNMRRIKERIEQLQKIQQTDFSTVEFSGGKVIPNKEINRLQIFFNEIPDQDIRKEMKNWGFHFSKSNNNAWQRQLNSNAFYAAKMVIKKYESMQQEQDNNSDYGMNMDM